MTLLNKDVEAKIDILMNEVSSLQWKIHQLSIEIFKGVKFSDVDYNHINYLFSKMGKGVNKQAYKVWIIDHTPLVWNKEEDKFIKPKKANWKSFNIVPMDTTPFYRYTRPTKEGEEVEYNEVAKLSAFKKRVNTLIDAFEEHDIDNNILKEIQTLLT